MNVIVEVCCGSYYDCVQAYQGGAQRVELNSALHMGGLTPSIGSLVLTKKHTKLKIITMVRPRGAGFHYHDEDFQVMVHDVKCMLEYGADGIAFGCLDEFGNIDVNQTKVIVDIVKAKGKEVVFHRAFDCVNDPYHAMVQLINLGVDRVLTSGQMQTAIKGKDLIKELQKIYGDQIEILAGSGINMGNASTFIKETDVHQIHSSCKAWKKDPTTTMNQVSYAYTNDDIFEVVDAKTVNSLIESVK